MNGQSLVVFDFDGTLSRGLTICEVLADSLGRLTRMQELERSKNRQEISAARQEMVSWYRGVTDVELRDSLQSVCLAPGLAEGISTLQAHGVTIAIASISWSFAVQHFARQWGIEHFIATSLLDTGEIDHVWPEDKAQFVLDLASQLRVPNERTAAVGDSSGDFEMLDVVGVPIFVGTVLPAHNQSWTHLPSADISSLAKRLIKIWAL